MSRGGAGPAPLAVGAERGAAQARGRAGRRAAGALEPRRHARRRPARRWLREARDGGRALRRGAGGRPRRRARADRAPAGRLRGRRRGAALDAVARALPRALPARARRAAPLRLGRRGRRAARRRVRRRLRLAARRPHRPALGARGVRAALRRRRRRRTGSPRAQSLSVDELDRRADHVDPASTALLGGLVGGEPAPVRPRADLGPGERQRRGDARAGRRRLGLLHRPGLDDRVLRAAGPRVGARGRRRPAADRAGLARARRARRWWPPTRRSCASWPEAAAARRPRPSRSRPRSGRRRATAGRPPSRRPSRAWCAPSRPGCRARAGSRTRPGRPPTAPACARASAPRRTRTSATTVPPMPMIGCGRSRTPARSAASSVRSSSSRCSTWSTASAARASTVRSLMRPTIPIIGIPSTVIRSGHAGFASAARADVLRPDRAAARAAARLRDHQGRRGDVGRARAPARRNAVRRARAAREGRLRRRSTARRARAARRAATTA